MDFIWKETAEDLDESYCDSLSEQLKGKVASVVLASILNIVGLCFKGTLYPWGWEDYCFFGMFFCLFAESMSDSRE